MTAVKVIIIALLLMIMVYFINNTNKVYVRAWKRIFFISFLLTGIISVIFPEFLDKIAQLIGIGRGADFLLYILVMAFFFVTVNVYLKFRELSLVINKLVSKIAIMEEENKK